MKHQSETKPISADDNRLFFRRLASWRGPNRGAKAHIGRRRACSRWFRPARAEIQRDFKARSGGNDGGRKEAENRLTVDAVERGHDISCTVQVTAQEHAVTEARQATAALNERNGETGRAPLNYGIGVHVGDVMYGNIGSRTRLDFTVIGPAVNMASRLETLTKQLGRTVLLSRAFADFVESDFDLERVGATPMRWMRFSARPARRAPMAGRLWARGRGALRLDYSAAT